MPCVDRGGPGLSLEPLDAFIVHVFASYEADNRHGRDFFVKKVHIRFIKTRREMRFVCLCLCSPPKIN